MKLKCSQQRPRSTSRMRGWGSSQGRGRNLFVSTRLGIRVVAKRGFFGKPVRSPFHLERFAGENAFVGLNQRRALS